MNKHVIAAMEGNGEFVGEVDGQQKADHVEDVRAMVATPAEAGGEVPETDQSIAADCYWHIADVIGTEANWSVQEHVEWMRELLQQASDYLHDIPESAVGGCDAAVELCRRLRLCLAGKAPGFLGDLPEYAQHSRIVAAKAAMSAKKANSINPEMVDVVGYTTAGMLRISKDLPLTGRIGAKCKPDERWNVPLMIVAQHSRIVASKDAEIARVTVERNRLIGNARSVFKDMAEMALKQRDELAKELAALRAKSARPGRAPEHSAYEAQRCALAKLLGAFRDAPKDADQAAAFTCADELFNATTGVLAKDAVQPARQVGGGEREQFEAAMGESVYFSPEGFEHDSGVWVYSDYTTDIAWRAWSRRAALAPAAVVMPETLANGIAMALTAFDIDGDRGTSKLAAKQLRDGVNDFTRLNRRAIPLGLMERVIAPPVDGERSSYDRTNAVLELRALLGKDGEVTNV